MAESIKVLGDIIKTEMQLADDRIILYNQKWILPNKSDILIILGYVSLNIVANNTKYETVNNELVEKQSLCKNDILSIDIISRDDSARLRKEETLLALSSTYAQQQLEVEGMSIGLLPVAFNDISEVEGATRLNRYNVNIQMFSTIYKEKNVDEFNKFSLETERSL